MDLVDTNYRAQKPVPWPGAAPGQFECNNETGAYQNIGVGRRSGFCMLIFSHPSFHTGFYQAGQQDPTTSLVLNAVT